jgi:xeroderma pigmentosum group C-complementing protein
MPPFLPRKRLRSPSPEPGSSRPRKANNKSISTPPRKPTLFDDLDAGTGQKRTADHSKALFEKLAGSDDHGSSLSSSEEEFEDVPTAKRQRSNDASEDDEDIEFEDVQTHTESGPSAAPPSGDLELTLRKDTRVSLTNPLGAKKGPSKIERGIRIATHQVHVQMLMWHNAIRNSWLCDSEVQEILLKQLPPGVQKEVERWRGDSGLKQKEEVAAKSKGKSKEGNIRGKKPDGRNQRDWGELAERLTSGQVNTSSGDPTIRLLKILTNYWRQRFRITAPGLRKLGYMSLERLDAEMKNYSENFDPELHGERIRDIAEFRELAKALEGSRDVGAQLFTALLRALGLEARMVVNLQPLGFGWSQNEDASEKNPRKLKKQVEMKDGYSSGDGEDDSESAQVPVKPTKGGKKPAVLSSKKLSKTSKRPGRRSSRSDRLKDTSIDLIDSEEPTSGNEDTDHSESVIDVTPARQRLQPSKPYDKDLLFPHYWTEVLSPVTNLYTPVDAVVFHMVANKSELLEKFEPRGAKADKAKQVTSYIIGHSPDGTAKDVTTRYLKRQTWPGRTKGNRIPVEKVPVYNRHGKVKHYEMYDWFKTVMSGYVRGSRKSPRTEIDDYEDITALKPAKPEKKVVEEGKETLQYYKSSSEFVLERHLRREEALLPTAKHVKLFTIKGKGHSSVEENVYLREDVVNCKTIETWHKEGRAPKDGEEPLKRVPYRAATTNRRRELAEAEQASGEKVLQALYSWDQTDWIIPPPIQNGIIPKNGFGNIDLYVDSMLPKGAAHIPWRGTVKVCKRLGIDYAEAVTGFEFGYRMAVPIITGVVVAKEHLEAVMEEWEKDEAERVRKEDEKRQKAAIGMWRKMLMGLRIVERVREEYGGEAGKEVDELNPWINKKNGKEVDRDAEARRRIMERRDEDMAGGFMAEGHDEEEPDTHHASSFFPVVNEGDDEYGGGFVVEGHDDEQAKPMIGQAYATPQSLQSNTKAGLVSVSEDDEEEEDAVDSEPEVEIRPVKRLRRPLGSANKPTKAKAQASVALGKRNAKRPRTQQMTPSSSRPGRRRRKVAESEKEDDDETTSSLSEPPSAFDDTDSEAEELSTKETKSRDGKEAFMSTMTEAPTRKTPRRNAARRSVEALRSHYFEHSDEEDDE